MACAMARASARERVRFDIAVRCVSPYAYIKTSSAPTLSTTLKPPGISTTRQGAGKRSRNEALGIAGAFLLSAIDGEDGAGEGLVENTVGCGTGLLLEAGNLCRIDGLRNDGADLLQPVFDPHRHDAMHAATNREGKAVAIERAIGAKQVEAAGVDIEAVAVVGEHVALLPVPLDERADHLIEILVVVHANPHSIPRRL